MDVINVCCCFRLILLIVLPRFFNNGRSHQSYVAFFTLLKFIFGSYTNFWKIVEFFGVLYLFSCGTHITEPPCYIGATNQQDYKFTELWSFHKTVKGFYLKLKHFNRAVKQVGQQNILTNNWLCVYKIVQHNCW